MAKRKPEASSRDEKRRIPKPFILPESQPDHMTPEQRLAEHLESKHNIGPYAGGTVRLTIREKCGGEKGAEGSLVRAMYDIANKPKRRSRRRKAERS